MIVGIYTTPDTPTAHAEGSEQRTCLFQFFLTTKKKSPYLRIKEPPILYHTHTHTHTHTHNHTHTHTQSLSLSLSLSHTHAHTHIHNHTHIHTRTHKHAHTRTHTHTHAHTHTHTHTHAHTHTHTHSHTYTLTHKRRFVAAKTIWVLPQWLWLFRARALRSRKSTLHSCKFYAGLFCESHLSL